MTIEITTQVAMSEDVFIMVYHVREVRLLQAEDPHEAVSNPNRHSIRACGNVSVAGDVAGRADPAGRSAGVSRCTNGELDGEAWLESTSASGPDRLTGSVGGG